MLKKCMEKLPKRWKGFPMLYLLKLFLREKWILQEDSNNIMVQWNSSFAYNDPLFIGGWIDISQLVSSVNGDSFGGISHLFSGPKEEG
jgi:hypothetical protein